MDETTIQSVTESCRSKLPLIWVGTHHHFARRSLTGNFEAQESMGVLALYRVIEDK